MRIVVNNIISLILPITVLVLVPFWIEKNISIKNISASIAGIAVIALGLCIVTHAVSLIVKIGRGTLAPWSPAQKLVIRGMYQYVRNPMIVGVLIALIGESITILSFKILIWAIIFFIINNVFFIAYEEPNLEKRFGDEYRKYKSNVPRWVPRTKPYKPSNEQS